MNLRASSILVTLLMLAVCAQPALAKKGKKDKAEDESAEQEASEGEGEAESEEVAEPDPWERPPADEEKPPPDEKKAAPKEEPVGDGKNVEIGLLLGYGFKTDRRTGDFGADPYGLAAGLSGGYTLDMQLYVGAYFLYFLGFSEEGGQQRVANVSGESSANYMNFGAEVGYDAWISGLLFRPSMHVGVGLVFADIAGETDQVADFALGPGMRVIVPLGDLFLGGDLRGHIVTGDGVSAVGAYFVIGHRMKQ